MLENRIIHPEKNFFQPSITIRNTVIVGYKQNGFKDFSVTIFKATVMHGTGDGDLLAVPVLLESINNALLEELIYNCCS